MAPSPKPPGQRVRRNKDQPKWQTLPAAESVSEPPAPEHWREETKQWWRVIWRSPMASQWIEADIPQLLRLGEMRDDPRAAGQKLMEIRYAEDAYGLSPKARKSLMWLIPAANDEEAEEQPAAKVRRLRAV